jgi:S-adenosylmethionine synthetase
MPQFETKVKKKLDIIITILDTNTKKGVNMAIYRGIRFVIKDENFVHFYNPTGKYQFREPGGEAALYGRDTLIRSIPEGFEGTPQEFAKNVINHLYDRMTAYKKDEARLYYAAKSTRNLKNLCK